MHSVVCPTGLRLQQAVNHCSSRARAPAVLLPWLQHCLVSPAPRVFLNHVCPCWVEISKSYKQLGYARSKQGEAVADQHRDRLSVWGEICRKIRDVCTISLAPNLHCCTLQLRSCSVTSNGLAQLCYSGVVFWPSSQREMQTRMAKNKMVASRPASHWGCKYFWLSSACLVDASIRASVPLPAQRRQ